MNKTLASIFFLFAIHFLAFSQPVLMPLSSDINRANSLVKAEPGKKNARIQNSISNNPITIRPIISIELTKGSTKICKNTLTNELEFKANTIFGGDSPIIDWYVNNIKTDTGNTFTITGLAENTSIYASLTSSLTCTSGISTVTSNTIQISASDTLNLSFTISALNNANRVCTNEIRPITILSNISNPHPNDQILWFIGSTLLSDFNNASQIIFENLAVGNSINAKLITGFECKALKTITSNFVSKIESRSLSPTIELYFNKIDGNCESQLYYFEAKGQNLGDNPTYKWYLNNSLISTTNNPIFTKNLENSGDEISVTVVPSYTCANPPQIASNSKARIDTIQIPFFEDFSQSVNEPNKNKFIKNEGTYINNTFCINQPTTNAATFDGLRYNGFAYDTITSTSHGIADRLTSLPLDLSGFSNSDNLYISFQWQAGGLGENPDSTNNDRLNLYFKNEDGSWVKVWEKGVKLATSNFKSENFVIANGIYDQTSNFLFKGFQFKFESVGRLTGSFDVWNLDYIYLNKNRFANDTFFIDQSFNGILPSLFNKYTALPYTHLSSIGDEYFKNSIPLQIRNLNNTFSNIRIDGVLSRKNGNGNQNLTPISTALASDSKRSFDISIDPNLVKNSDFERNELQLNFTLKSDTLFNGVDFKVNNTLTGTTIIDNFYAYDDGSAEYSLGINQNGAILAQKFEIFKEDSLREVVIAYVHAGIVLQNQSYNFYICKRRPTFRELSGDDPGNVVMYFDNTQLKYPKSINNWETIKLSSAIAVKDSFYVLIRQITDGMITIGWDKNTNSAEKIFYQTGFGWKNYAQEYPESQGSLMIRPVFGSYNYLINQKPILRTEISLYPNPSKDIVYFNTEQSVDIEQVEIINQQGLNLKKYQNSISNLDISDLQNGIYFVKIVLKDGRIFSQKLVKI